MILPNSEAILFCNWLLDVSWQRLSGSQRIIVEAVRTSAQTATPISNNNWNNFNKFTAWRYPFYQVYATLASSLTPDLLAGLIAAWDFEGNSNCSDPTYNGSDTSVIYNLAYGKIIQGVAFSGPPSEITHAALNTTATFTLNIWVNIGSFTSTADSIWTNGIVSAGLFGFQPNTDIYWFSSGVILHTPSLTLNTWYMITITSSPTLGELFLNGVSVASTLTPFPPVTLSSFGKVSGSFNYTGFLDAPVIWDRGLLQSEIDMLYNGGAGLQYPF